MREFAQLTDFVRLATPLARFGKVDRTATNQKAGSSNPPGRTILTSKHAGFCDVSGQRCPEADYGITSWITCGDTLHSEAAALTFAVSGELLRGPLSPLFTL